MSMNLMSAIYEKHVGREAEAIYGKQLTKKRLLDLKRSMYNFAEEYAIEKLRRKRIKDDFSEEFVGNMSGTESPLLKKVREWCEAMDVPYRDVIGRDRKEIIRVPRQICQYKLAMHLGVSDSSFRLIGSIWGTGRNRATVRSNFYKIRNYIKMKDPMVMHYMNLIGENESLINEE